MTTKKKEKKKIVDFIKNISDNDYAQASSSLKKILHEKIKQRIQAVANKPLF